MTSVLIRKENVDTFASTMDIHTGRTRQEQQTHGIKPGSCQSVGHDASVNLKDLLVTQSKFI